MNFDVIIIGGGLVGASVAAALKRSGLSLALVESQPVSMRHRAPASNLHFPHPPSTSSGQAKPPPEGEGVIASLRELQFNEWDSRVYAISPGSRTFLKQSGAWSLLDATRIAPVETMRVFGDTGAELEFSAYQMGVAELACIVENRALQQALWQVLQTQENLTLLHPHRCTSLQFAAEAATLTLEDGRTLTANLIVGADGRDSWVPRRLASVPRRWIFSNMGWWPIFLQHCHIAILLTSGSSRMAFSRCCHYPATGFPWCGR